MSFFNLSSNTRYVNYTIVIFWFISLCEIDNVNAANFGMYYRDFTDPKLNLKGIHLIIFWDRAFTTESCISFYNMLYNCIDEEVLLLHSTSKLRNERLALLEEFFVVEFGPKHRINMKGGASDTIQLLKLNKNPSASACCNVPLTLDPPLIDQALKDFTEGQRVASYQKIINKTTLKRTRVNPKKRFRVEDIY